MKAENLKRMREGGIRVPLFELFSFERLLPEAKGLQEKIRLFKEQEAPDPAFWSGKLQESLGEAFVYDGRLSLKAGSFSVRSSCNLEDGEDYSFAGIFESFLEVREEELPAKILSCLQSLYSVRALEYMLLRGIDIGELRMDVIVQEMVQSEVSGIFFTANPRGILNESVITAGRGLGDLVVSGEAETTTYFYHQTDRNFYTEGDAELLSFALLEELLETGGKILQILSMDYADIEFAVAEEEIFILQARPITALARSEDIILDNSNIVESYPGISLPLTDSFARMIYQGVFRGVAARVLQDPDKVGEMSEVFAHMVDSVNGRMFYRIDNWYGILRFLPMSKKIIPVWQEMLGVRNRQYREKAKEQPLHKQLRTAFYFLKELIFVPSSMERLNRSFLEIAGRFEERDCGGLSSPELLELFAEIRDKLLSVWDITLINDMYAFLFTGLLKKKLRKKEPLQFEERTADFISGIAHIESMKPIRELADLASLKEREGESGRYRQAFLRYIRDYGDRTMEELKLETLTFRTNPELLEEKIDEYLQDPQKLHQLQQDLGRAQGDLKERGMRGFLAERAMLGIKNREISRLNRCRIFGMVRRIFLAMGENLCREGCIGEVRDVFYLRLEELKALADSPRDMRPLIGERKAEYQEYALMQPCSRLILKNLEAKSSFRRFSKRKKSREDDLWQGIPCSGGCVGGEVAVVRRPEDAAGLKDKIIAAKMTDPGWIFVLANARGIVTEKGSLLSHTAIISRELGIPAVVGVDEITESLRDGDFLLLDGNSGEVRRVETNLPSQE